MGGVRVLLVWGLAAVQVSLLKYEAFSAGDGMVEGLTVEMMF